MTSAHGPPGTAGAAAGPELQVLGPFSLVVDGRPLDLGMRKARALVAVLALEGPQPRAGLAELLWGELGEPSARNNLRKTLHALRETRLAAYLDTSGETVACRGARVDVLDFERLAASGEPERALGLGEGMLLEGLDLESETWNEWLEGRRASHAALRRQVHLDVATLREARGDMRGALEVVSRVLDLDAFDERALREAMRLHLTLGDRSQVTALYERFRTLTAPLGLVPDAATRALAERARQDSPDRPPPAGSPARAEALRAPLVGREASWLQLHRSGKPLIVLVGEPGVGKTRLATQFAGAHGAGLTLRGREETRYTPFSPVAQLIRGALETRRWSPEGLGDVWRLEVARLVPECAPGTVPPPAVGEGRARFVEGLARAMTDVLGGRMLLLDDLHWFDEGTLELVSHLVRRGVRFIATARGPELETSGAARRTLEGLRRDGLSETLTLRPLAEPDVLALVQGFSGAGGGVLFARRLHAATRGNPLYILELLRGLLETGLLTAAPEGGWATPFDESTRDYAELPIPSSLRETVLERVARLGPAARRLLEGAALAGEPFESAWLAGIEADESARLDALEEACRADLLEPVPGGFHFRHELLRRALDESLGYERRRLTHHTLARQLQAARAPPERVASHFERAGRGEEALPHLERAAEAAARVYAYREAVAYTERMLDHEGDDARRWGLERQRLWFLSLVTDAGTYEGQMDRFERLAERSGDPNRRAEVYFMRGLFHLFRGQAAEIAAQAEAMLALPHLSAESRVNALYVDGHAQTSLGRPVQAMERFSQALDLRRAAPGTEASVSAENIENGLTRACLACGEFGRAAFHNRQVLARLEGTSAQALVYTLNWRAYLATLRGQFGPARETFARAEALASKRRDPSALTWVLRHRTSLLLALGQSGAALEDIGTVLRLSAGQYLRLEAILTGLRAEALRLRGGLGEALGASHDALAALERIEASGADPALVEGRIALAGLLTECGDLRAARAQQETVRALDEQSDGVALRLYRVSLETAAARLDLANGQTGRALERLRATPHLRNAPFADRAAHATELARALVLGGNPDGALRRLARLEPPPPLLPRVLNVRLAAHLALGEVPGDVLGHATSVLDLEHAAPTDRLELRVTVIRALEHAGRDPSAVRALARATLTALADSLAGHPEGPSGLLRRFPTVLDGQAGKPVSHSGAPPGPEGTSPPDGGNAAGTPRGLPSGPG